jgi:hypothetical protein
MASLITAFAIFFVVASIIAVLRAEDESVATFADSPRRLPNPGSRDLHTVVGATLGRAHVPSWG